MQIAVTGYMIIDNCLLLMCASLQLSSIVRLDESPCSMDCQGRRATCHTRASELYNDLEMQSENCQSVIHQFKGRSGAASVSV
jgi:hypothetical protein